jgi:regulator of sigma E protease
MESIFGLAQHYLLPFLVVLSVVVFVHEFGHYWIARMCGVKIEAFSIGFGREIFGWKDKHGTRWKVSWLPLGGYVKMYGDAGPASTPDASVKEMTAAQKKVSYFHQDVEKRFAIAAAGPLANYAFAIIVLAFLFMLHGQPFSSPVVSDVMENSVAAKAGFQKGDRVLVVDGTNIERFEDIKRIVAMNSGTPIKVTALRGHKQVTFTVTPEVATMLDRFGGEHQTRRIGITTDAIEYKQWPLPQAMLHAIGETWELTTDTLKGTGQMIMGLRSADEIGGPIRIAKLSGEVAKDGIVALIWFMAVISINLGLINLFPVPLLDGGHLLYYGIEWLRGRPLHQNVQEAGFRVGMAFILCLMLFATWNDLVNLKVISYLRGLFS